MLFNKVTLFGNVRLNKKQVICFGHCTQMTYVAFFSFVCLFWLIFVQNNVFYHSHFQSVLCGLCRKQGK